MFKKEQDRVREMKKLQTVYSKNYFLRSDLLAMTGKKLILALASKNFRLLNPALRFIIYVKFEQLKKTIPLSVTFVVSFYLPQPSSSAPSEQSWWPSHFIQRGKHAPLKHRNPVQFAPETTDNKQNKM